MSKADEIADSWSQFKEDQPGIALVLSMLPVTGQIAAVTDYYKAMRDGDTQDAVLAALSFVPGGAFGGMKLLQEANATLKSADNYSELAKTVFAQSQSPRNVRHAVGLADYASGLAQTGRTAAREGVGGLTSSTSNVIDYLKEKHPY